MIYNNRRVIQQVRKLYEHKYLNKIWIFIQKRMNLDCNKMNYKIEDNQK